MTSRRYDIDANAAPKLSSSEHWRGEEGRRERERERDRNVTTLHINLGPQALSEKAWGRGYGKYKV